MKKAVREKRKTAGHFNDLLLPVILVLCVLPFVVYLAEYDTGFLYLLPEKYFPCGRMDFVLVYIYESGDRGTGCGRGRYLSRMLDQKKDNRLESIVTSQDGVTITYGGKSYRFFSFWIMDNYIDWSTLSCDTTHLPRYFSL